MLVTEVRSQREKGYQARSPNLSFADRPQKLSIPSSPLLNIIFPYANFPAN
ncbi:MULTISPECIES: hypothetical protein [unclassified Microcoleus]